MEGVGTAVIFLVSGKLFASSRTRNADLLALLRGVALRGHTLFVVDDPHGSSSIEAKEFGSWVTGLNAMLQREVAWIRERIRRVPPTAVTRGATAIAVAEAGNPDLVAQRIVLDLSAAVRLATMPLFVLVENGLTDAAFVRRTMPPSWRRKIREWERAGAIRFEHAGGIGEMKKIVEHCSAGGTSDPLGLGPSAWRASHVLVSDRDSQDQRGGPSSDVGDLVRACSRANMKDRLHVLCRRDQESYLPDEALRAIVATKSGKLERDDMLARLASHFANTKGRHHVPVPKVGEVSWFKNAFLRYESSIAWDDAWFVRDGSGPEMVDLAEMIAAFL